MRRRTGWPVHTPTSVSGSGTTCRSRCPTRSSGSRRSSRAGSWAPCRSRCRRVFPRGRVPSVPADFVADATLSDAPLPEAVSPVWKSMTSGGSTGRPKLIEAGGDSRLPAEGGYALGAQLGDVNLISVPLSHSTGFIAATTVPTTCRPAAARRRGQGAPLGGARRGHLATAGSGASLTELSSGVTAWRLSQRRNAFRHGDSTRA